MWKKKTKRAANPRRPSRADVAWILEALFSVVEDRF
jgi:hypothetical protein